MNKKILEFKLNNDEIAMMNVAYRLEQHKKLIQNPRAIEILKRLENSKQDYGDHAELLEDIVADFGELANDENFIKAAVTIVPDCIYSASNELKGNKSVLREAIETDYSIIDKIDKDILLNNPELISLAVKKFNSEIFEKEVIKKIESGTINEENSLDQYEIINQEIGKYSDIEKFEAMLELNNSKYFQDEEIMEVLKNYEKSILEIKIKKNKEDTNELTLNQEKLKRINSGEKLVLPVLESYRQHKANFKSLFELSNQKKELTIKEKQAKELLKDYEVQQKTNKDVIGE